MSVVGVGMNMVIRTRFCVCASTHVSVRVFYGRETGGVGVQ